LVFVVVAAAADWTRNFGRPKWNLNLLIEWSNIYQSLIEHLVLLNYFSFLMLIHLHLMIVLTHLVIVVYLWKRKFFQIKSNTRRNQFTIDQSSCLSRCCTTKKGFLIQKSKTEKISLTLSRYVISKYLYLLMNVYLMNYSFHPNLFQ